MLVLDVCIWICDHGIWYKWNFHPRHTKTSRRGVFESYRMIDRYNRAGLLERTNWRALWARSRLVIAVDESYVWQTKRARCCCCCINTHKFVVAFVHESQSARMADSMSQDSLNHDRYWNGNHQRDRDRRTSCRCDDSFDVPPFDLWHKCFIGKQRSMFPLR